MVYFLTLGGIILWIGLIIIVPYLKSKSISLNTFGYAMFSPICHQIPSRSFFLFRHPLAVCSRCFGIYVGSLLGVLSYPLVHKFSIASLPKPRTLILVSLPIVVDTIGNFLHLWLTPNLPRFFIGILWGVILPFYFITGITDFVLSIRHKRESLI